MKRLKYHLFLLLLFIAYSCQFGQKSGTCIIAGQINGNHPGKVYLKEFDTRETKVIDSARIDENGSFLIKFSIDTVSMFAIQFNDEFFITIIAGGGDTISTNVDISQTPVKYTVTGNDESSLLAEYEQYSKLNIHRIDSLRVLFEQSKGDPGFFAIRSLIDQSYQEIIYDQKVYVREFISKHPQSLSSLVVLNRNFMQIDLFDEVEDFSYFHLLDSSLALSYPGNKHFLKHHQITDKVRQKRKEEEHAASRLSPGKHAPDVTMDGWNGQPYQLSDLQGNYVILYFWAAGNARSRQVNKELKALYSDHKDRGLEVYAVSLDSNEEIWKAAIKLDQLDFIHVSDLMGAHSPVAKLYQVPGKLPYIYLLDKQGFIMFKGHNYGEVEELLLSSLAESV